MSEPTTPATEETVVPVRDLMAVKNTLSRQIDELRQEMATRDQQIQELTDRLNDDSNASDPADVAETRKQLQKERNKLLTEMKQLDAEKKTLQEGKRELLVNKLVAEYGVKPEELAQFQTEAEMKVYCLEAKAKKLETESKKTAGASPKTRYESGTPASAKKSPLDMTDEEFALHVKNQEQLALSRR